MAMYYGRTETDIEVYPTASGHISIKGTGLEDGRTVTILLSSRQALYLQNDLKELAKMADQNFEAFCLQLDEQNDAEIDEPEQKDA